MQDQVNEGGDGQSARYFTGLVAAHAVGHEHAVANFCESLGNKPRRKIGHDGFQRSLDARDQEMILVVLPHLALVGQRGEVHLDSGRDVSRRQDTGRGSRKSVFRRV